jgi:hypothetical protein
MANIDKLYEGIVHSDVRIFYLYGRHGAGREQLIHQIAERYTSEHPSANIFYVNSVYPIDKNRLDHADIVVLNNFDPIDRNIDEVTLYHLCNEFCKPTGRRRVLLVTSQIAPTVESPFHEAARLLLYHAALVDVQVYQEELLLQKELFRARTDFSPELTIYVDPGSAPAEAVGELLAELSQLYRMIGGSGITFTNSGVAFPEGVQ